MLFTPVIKRIMRDVAIGVSAASFPGMGASLAMNGCLDVRHAMLATLVFLSFSVVFEISRRIAKRTG